MTRPAGSARRPLGAADLGIRMRAGDERALFKWFVASFLFGKRVQQTVALRTYRVLVEAHGLDSPRKIARCSWQELVDLLDEGHYVRYDESTARRLLALARKLVGEYDGRLGRLRELCSDAAELKSRLLEFDGVGPKTLEIFLREAGPVWGIDDEDRD